MSSANAFLEAIQGRRSYYDIDKNIPVSDERVKEIISTAIQAVPSSFNAQSNRAVVLLGNEHEKLWDLTTETLKAIVPAEAWEHTAQRMAGFRAGHGTVLFYEDPEPVKALQQKFAIYADRFPGWATESLAMLQFAVWTALEAEGLAANIQHYNPLIDEKVSQEWKINPTWTLRAQVVFGGKKGEAGPKETAPIETKLQVFSS